MTIKNNIYFHLTNKYKRKEKFKPKLQTIYETNFYFYTVAFLNFFNFNDYNTL